VAATYRVDIPYDEVCILGTRCQHFTVVGEFAKPNIIVMLVENLLGDRRKAFSVSAKQKNESDLPFPVPHKNKME